MCTSGANFENIFRDLEHALTVLDKTDRTRRVLYRLAVDYMKMRLDWAAGDQERRVHLATARSRAHDAFIAQLNAVSRQAGAQGLSLSWSRALAEDGGTANVSGSAISRAIWPLCLHFVRNEML